MFKKFTTKDTLQITQPKSSATRKVRSLIQEQFPNLNDATLDVIMPKKSSFQFVKPKEIQHLEIIAIDGVPTFCKWNDDFFPTLQILHQYPDMMPHQQVDRGAVKFVLSGADIMCKGVTSEGGKLNEEVASGAIVAVMVEGKESALAIGKMTISGKEIKEKNDGVGITLIHYMDDGLYRTKEFEQIKSGKGK